MPTFAIFSTLQSLPLQFTPPRLGLNFPWNEPTFACRGSHVIRPQFDEVFRQETIVRSTKQQQQQQRQQQQKRTHCIQWGDSSPRLDHPQKSPL